MVVLNGCTDNVSYCFVLYSHNERRCGLNFYWTDIKSDARRTNMKEDTVNRADGSMFMKGEVLSNNLSYEMIVSMNEEGTLMHHL